MDIETSYNVVLGTPWIHFIGAVPSSMHQKIKIVKDRKLVTVCREEEFIAQISDEAPPYVDPT